MLPLSGFAFQVDALCPAGYSQQTLKITILLPETSALDALRKLCGILNRRFSDLIAGVSAKKFEQVYTLWFHPATQIAAMKTPCFMS